MSAVEFSRIEENSMNLGAFSISLPVADLGRSRTFYESLGFSVTGGDETSWVVMRNGTTTVGLFHGMFDKPMLTFNPGWNNKAEPVDPFEDVREIQAALKAAGLEIGKQANPDTTGPEFITLTDPDGNPILIDQHR